MNFHSLILKFYFKPLLFAFKIVTYTELNVGWVYRSSTHLTIKIIVFQGVTVKNESLAFGKHFARF